MFLAERVGFKLLAMSQYSIGFISLKKLFYPHFYPHIALPLKISATVRKL